MTSGQQCHAQQQQQQQTHGKINISYLFPKIDYWNMARAINPYLYLNMKRDATGFEKKKKEEHFLLPGVQLPLAFENP